MALHHSPIYEHLFHTVSMAHRADRKKPSPPDGGEGLLSSLLVNHRVSVRRASYAAERFEDETAAVTTPPRPITTRDPLTSMTV